MKIVKSILFSVIIICGTAFSQPKLPVFSPPLLSDINIIPNDSVYAVYYSYRVPTRSFVFFKDGNIYTADFRITVEVRDSSSTFFTRQIDEKIIKADNFDETVSGNSSEEGLFVFHLKKGKYIFSPILTDLNSNRDYRLNPLKIECEESRYPDFRRPVVIDQNENDGRRTYRMTNYAGDIPFSENSYDLIIPARDTAVHKINAIFIDNADTVAEKDVSDSFVSGLTFKSGKGNIFIESNKSAKPTRNFIVKNFSKKLLEGRVKIIVESEGNDKIKKDFMNRVVWFDKPFSLRDPERAIRLLSVVESSSLVDSLLSGDSKNYERNLFNYWKRLDPTKNSAFNPLMEEYYERVDYALRHFYPLSRKREELTDRSKVYIKYGKPAEVRRSYDTYGKSVETWVYNKPPAVFNFIDPDGTGNFILVQKNE